MVQQRPVDRPQLGPGFDLGKNTCQNGEKQGELSSKSIDTFPQGRESEEIGIFSPNIKSAVPRPKPAITKAPVGAKACFRRFPSLYDYWLFLF